MASALERARSHSPCLRSLGIVVAESTVRLMNVAAEQLFLGGVRPDGQAGQQAGAEGGGLQHAGPRPPPAVPMASARALTNTSLSDMPPSIRNE